MNSSPSPLRCPKCDSTDVRSIGKRYALYPVGCLIVLSWLFAWIHRCSAPYEFECRACGRRFVKRTAAAELALVGFWVLLALFVAVAFWMGLGL